MIQLVRTAPFPCVRRLLLATLPPGLVVLGLASLAGCDAVRGNGTETPRGAAGAHAIPPPTRPLSLPSRNVTSSEWGEAVPPDTTPSDSASTGREGESADSDSADADSAPSDTAGPPPPRPDSGLSSEAVAAMKAALGLPAAESAAAPPAVEPRGGPAAGDTVRPPPARATGPAAADTIPRTVEALREAGPAYVPYDAGPTLVRDRELQRLLEEHLVPVIEEQSLSVRTSTRFWVLVDAEGEVSDAVIQTPSGHPAFDRAAAQVAMELRYEPAIHGGEPSPVWVLARVSLLMP